MFKNVIHTSYKCLLLNGIAVIFAAQTDNAWISLKYEEQGRR